MAGIIELRNVSYAAQNRKLVHNVSYLFSEGKATALVGPSGGGKSTVLKLTAGLLFPSEGEVLFRGNVVAKMNRTENLSFRREAAMVFQDSALWANQNLFQILELPLRVHFPSMTRSERERKVESVVAEVGYKKDLGIRPSHLSMGEQKLIAFARALMCGPRVLFLDEWTESLDENASQRLIGMVRKLRDDGVTVILVSHDMRIIHELVDIVVMVLGGKLFLHLTREQIDADDDLKGYVERGMTT